MSQNFSMLRSPEVLSSMDPIMLPFTTNNLEKIFYVCFGVILVSVQACDVYYNILPDIVAGAQSIYSSFKNFQRNVLHWIRILVKCIKDFHSGKYYKPWKSSQPVIIIRDKKQFTELSEAPVLSQRAVYADMFGFKHTMNNLDHHEHRVARTRLYGRLLQVNGPSQLSALYPFLASKLQKSMDEELLNGRRVNDGISMPITNTVRRLASQMMSIIFFGDEIASKPEVRDALLRYPRDMVSCMAAFQVTPSFISPFVHSLLTKKGQAMHKILEQLTWVFGRGKDLWEEPEETKKHTIAWNMTRLTEGNEYWTPEVLAQSLLGIWFAASHQPYMNLNFVLLELCVRQDWVTALREELSDADPLDYQRLEALPLLDSFVKETVRLNPLDTLAIRRKALEPYAFSNGGPRIPSGSTVCVSSYDLMHDPATYPDPDTFIGGRFAQVRDAAKQKRLTDVSDDFPVWGHGSLACPGRFHASLVMKMVLAHLVLNFDLRLEDEKARRKWSWETFTMPYEKTRVVFSKRSK